MSSADRDKTPEQENKNNDEVEKRKSQIADAVKDTVPEKSNADTPLQSGRPSQPPPTAKMRSSYTPKEENVGLEPISSSGDKRQSTQDYPEKHPPVQQQAAEKPRVGAEPPIQKQPGESRPELARDPHELNQHLRLVFTDIIAEPEPTTYSSDKVWALSEKCFTGSKGSCYRLLTTCCAIPVSFCLGLQFACLAFNYIWCIGPAIRVFEVMMVPARRVFSAVVRAFLVPICTAIGYVGSKIRITRTADTLQPPKYEDNV